MTLKGECHDPQYVWTQLDSGCRYRLGYNDDDPNRQDKVMTLNMLRAEIFRKQLLMLFSNKPTIANYSIVCYETVYRRLS